MKKIVIFGAGETGTAAFDFFGEQRVAAFADNVKTGEYWGKPIRSFDELSALLPEILIVVASLQYQDEIVDQLCSHSIKNYYVFTGREWDILPAKVDNDSTQYSHFDEILSLSKIHEYPSTALYGDNHCLDLLLASLYICDCVDKVKYIVSSEVDTYKGNQYGIPVLSKCSEAEHVDAIIVALPKNNCEVPDEVKQLNHPIINIYDYGKPKYWVYSSEIIKFRNFHEGKRCFIIGTGPSLRMEDLEKLHSQGQSCIGTNKIFLAFPQTNWRPDYYIIIDRRQISQYQKEIFELPLQYKFVADRRLPFWDTEYAEGSIKIRMKDQFDSVHMPSFSKDISECVYEGSTVTYAAMQLAVYMGFNEIYLLGVDFNYSGDFSKGENHFCKDYMRENEVYLISDQDKVLLAYKKAEIFSREHGFRIFNATRGGKLEVFERIDFDSLFDKANLPIQI